MSRAPGRDRERIAEEAARIVVEEALTDYRLAKQKAAERLGFGGQAPLPSNADLQEAVIRYQRLFGGRDYAQRLQQMRRTALQAMRLFADFQPRLVGAVASGATTDAHEVQLHCFADKPELIDVQLESRGLRFEVDQRRYRYGDGSNADIPVLHFDAGGIGVAIAVFPASELRRPPLSPVDGQPTQRLTIPEVEALARQTPDVIAG